jgi:hypothetical protein
MPHVPSGGLGGPVPPVAKDGGFGSPRGSARNAVNNQRGRRCLCISRGPFILNVRLEPLELNALNLLELVGDTTQFEQIAVTKVTRNLEVRFATAARSASGEEPSRGGPVWNWRDALGRPG